MKLTFIDIYIYIYIYILHLAGAEPLRGRRKALKVRLQIRACRQNLSMFVYVCLYYAFVAFAYVGKTSTSPA